MKSFGILSNIKNIYKVLNDLTECKCNDCKVIAFQTKYWDSDDNTEDCCYYNTDQKCKQKSYNRILDHISHTF